MGDYRAIDMRVGHGQVLVTFYRDSPDPGVGGDSLFSLYDSTTGERIVDYEMSVEERGIPACYTANAFTFLRSGENQLEIVRAVHR
jgi:hypothetical protein